MVQLNLALREINCKVVYFGCGLGGKTTNLEIVHQKAAPDSRGELTSIATESDRTLFFDFMPLDLGEVSGMRIKFQLYTVPGQVYYNSTRKLVLRGADGVIFVADSQKSKLEENIESIDNLEECLKEQGRSLADMPHVIQFNKRDLDDILSMEELEKQLNRYGASCNGATASTGEGVLETFKALAAMMLEKVKAMSTESSAKPGGGGTGSHRLEPKAAAPAKNEQLLQGGIGATPASPQPIVKISNTPIDSGTPKPAAEPVRPSGFESNAAPGALPPRQQPAAHLNPDPVETPPPTPPPAAAELSPKVELPPQEPAAEYAPEPVADPVATATIEPVTPSIREPRSESPPKRGRTSITTGSVQIMGQGMMISSSSRRRGGGDGKLFWVLGFLVLGAAAAAGWYYFLR